MKNLRLSKVKPKGGELMEIRNLKQELNFSTQNYPLKESKQI